MKAKGFTLIELLVVISIISLLSSAVLSSLSGAREQAKITSARSELNNIRSSIQRMITDTGAWPGGCDPGYYNSNILFYLNESFSGLVDPPSAGTVTGYYGGTCTWSPNEVADWDGPYVSNGDLLKDPWGKPYAFDTHYVFDTSNCPNGEPTNSEYTGAGAKIYSQAVWTRDNGEDVFKDDSPSSYYAVCDDIWVEIGPHK